MVSARYFHVCSSRVLPCLSSGGRRRVKRVQEQAREVSGVRTRIPARNNPEERASVFPVDLGLSNLSLGVEETLDAIVVLGGGLWQSSVIPPWAERRLDGAALLREACVERMPTASPPSILICGGGSPHGLPVLDASTGQVVHEGTAYAEYLVSRWGVPSSGLLKESSSYDTVGNGYFSAMIHAVPSGWGRMAVVTSEFHMERSRAIFETVYGLVERSLGVRVGLEFVAVRDDGVEGEVKRGRAEKERASLETWRRNTDGMESLKGRLLRSCCCGMLRVSTSLFSFVRPCQPRVSCVALLDAHLLRRRAATPVWCEPRSVRSLDPLDSTLDSTLDRSIARSPDSGSLTRWPNTLARRRSGSY